MNISNLIIEATRRCNMQCEHCLRGDLQNIDMDKDHMRNLLSQVKNIDSVTFSGGEPSLNPKAILDFIELAKYYNVWVSSFYIATNGKRISEEFIIACLKLFSFCEEKETCCVDVSCDDFHKQEHYFIMEESLLSGLSFVGVRTGDYYGKNWLAEGRFEEVGGRINVVESLEIDEDYGCICEGNLYLNCFGEIILGCDWSFKNQSKHKICNVSDDIWEACLEYYRKQEEEEAA